VPSLEWVSLSRDPKEVTKHLPSKLEAQSSNCSTGVKWRKKTGCYTKKKLSDDI
jgi:hypothetical protein